MHLRHCRPTSFSFSFTLPHKRPNRHNKLLCGFCTDTAPSSKSSSSHNSDTVTTTPWEVDSTLLVIATIRPLIVLSSGALPRRSLNGLAGLGSRARVVMAMREACVDYCVTDLWVLMGEMFPIRRAVVYW